EVPDEKFKNRAEGKSSLQILGGHELEEMNGSAPGVPGEVRVTYWPEGKRGAVVESPWEEVEPMADYCHQILLSELAAGTSYKLEVAGRAPGGNQSSVTLVGGFNTAPAEDVAAPVRFTVVTGQSYWRRDDPENGHRIYPRMLALEPDFFVHTGDIEYYDSARPWAVNAELARYKWNRLYALPFQRDFHRQVASYFEKDDHDTTKNDSWPGQDYGDLTWEEGLAIFREQFPMGEKTYRTYRWGKDLQVWFVEGRDFRSPNNMPDGPEKTIWGAEQKQWFFRTVEASDATFRVLLSPTPIVGPDRVKKNDNHANRGFTHEGNELRAFIGSQSNMFVVCGDRHWQYVSVDPVSGTREYSCGPTSEEHAGGFSQKYRSEMHRYLNVVGGFLEVAVDREGGNPRIAFRHHGVDGAVLNEEAHRASRAGNQ
ncbi:MAG: alkaline phosphatase, partial [Verrucomicrobiales bacterium]